MSGLTAGIGRSTAMSARHTCVDLRQPTIRR